MKARFQPVFIDGSITGEACDIQRYKYTKFKSVCGVAPSKIREEGIMIKAYPPIHFHITIKGESKMDYRIVKKEAFKIVGISAPLEKEIERNFEIVPKMWENAVFEVWIPVEKK